MSPGHELAGRVRISLLPAANPELHIEVLQPAATTPVDWGDLEFCSLLILIFCNRQYHLQWGTRCPEMSITQSPTFESRRKRHLPCHFNCDKAEFSWTSNRRLFRSAVFPWRSKSCWSSSVKSPGSAPITQKRIESRASRPFNFRGGHTMPLRPATTFNFPIR